MPFLPCFLEEKGRKQLKSLPGKEGFRVFMCNCSGKLHQLLYFLEGQVPHIQPLRHTQMTRISNGQSVRPEIGYYMDLVCGKATL